MVPVRSRTPKELIYQFHELAERLSAFGVRYVAAFDRGRPRTQNSVHRSA